MSHNSHGSDNHLLAQSQEEVYTPYSDVPETSAFTEQLEMNVEPKPINNHRNAITSPPVRVEPLRVEDFVTSYASEIPVSNNGAYGALVHSFGKCFGNISLIPGCYCFPFPYKKVNQGSVGLVTRFGQFYKAVDPGLVKVNVFSEELRSVDIRLQVMEIPSQHCMSKDNVNIELSSVVYYQIESPHRAIFTIRDYTQALLERTKTTLRLVVGSRTLQEIVERREEVANSIQEIIGEVSSSWGINVESILIKDITLSSELQSTLAQAAKSKRLGESKIITAKAEVESAKLMRKAADILESKAAMQIRYLDAMQTMARQSHSKVIFMPSSAAIESLASNASGGGNNQNYNNNSNKKNKGKSSNNINNNNNKIEEVNDDNDNDDVEDVENATNNRIGNSGTTTDNFASQAMRADAAVTMEFEELLV